MSGTGSLACQLAKNVFKAGKVITTVSTAKVPRVPELLGEGVVDQGQYTYQDAQRRPVLMEFHSVIDYTKSSPLSAIPRGSVDFILDTTGDSMTYLSLMLSKTSLIISISTTPSATQIQTADFMDRPDKPQVPWYSRMILTSMDAVRKARAWRWGVEYSHMFLGTNAEDLQALGKWVEEGKLRPVVGTRVQFRKLEKVKEAAGQVYEGKGGIGKAVILMK